MFPTLKNHPFAVEAFFEASLVLTYAVPKKVLEPMLPECLQLDSFKDEWGFIAAAFVNTKNLRPKGLPAYLGNDFILAGYRVFVRYETSYGKRLRGLYIIKSETNKKRMAFWGNIFTHYHYSTTDIHFELEKDTIKVCSEQSQINVQVRHSTMPPLPAQSPFQDWKEARRFAGPLPFTFTVNKSKAEVLIIEGVREAWTPKPVEVLDHRIGFIDSLNLEGAVLANAFVVQHIPYAWKKGRIDSWKS